MNKRVTRHELTNKDFFRRIYLETIQERLQIFLVAGRAQSRNLDLLVSNASSVVTTGTALGIRGAEVVRCLRLLAQANTALVAVAFRRPVTVPLDGEPVTYTTAPDESTVHTGCWFGGFFAALVCRDGDSLDRLCAVPTDFFRRSSTRSSEYCYSFIEALRAFHLDRGSPVELALQSMRLTDPDRDDIYDAEYTLYRVVHQIRLFCLILARDEDFGEALALALEDHKTYWSADEDRLHNPDGFLPMELLGLAALAHDLDIPFEVESEYLPPEFVTGAAFE